MADNKYGRFLKQSINNVVRALYPNVCPVCGNVLAENILICTDCRKQVQLVGNIRCEKCGKPLFEEEHLLCKDCQNKQRYFDKGIAVFEHTGVIRDSIYKFKFDNIRSFAEYYAVTAVERYKDIIKQWKIDLIVPVPIYKRKKIKRGYNQAAVFGAEVSKQLNIPMDERILVRVRETKPQKGLADTERYLNLKNAFAVDKYRLIGIESVLLVDDIFTTGSTVDACGRVLKLAGVKRVYVLCISAGRDREE